VRNAHGRPIASKTQNEAVPSGRDMRRAPPYPGREMHASFFFTTAYDRVPDMDDPSNRARTATPRAERCSGQPGKVLRLYNRHTDRGAGHDRQNRHGRADHTAPCRRARVRSRHRHSAAWHCEGASKCPRFTAQRGARCSAFARERSRRPKINKGAHRSSDVRRAPGETAAPTSAMLAVAPG